MLWEQVGAASTVSCMLQDNTLDGTVEIPDSLVANQCIEDFQWIVKINKGSLGHMNLILFDWHPLTPSAIQKQ